MKRKILSIIAALSFTTIGVTAQSFTVDYYVPIVGSGRVIISIEDAAEIADLQMTLSLPEGFTLNEESIDYGIVQWSATNDHVLSVKPLASGDYLIILYSLGRGTISNGTLLSFPYTVADGAQDGEMRLHTIRTSSVDAVSQMCNNVVVSMTALPLYKIVIKQETATLAVGDTLTLTSIAVPKGATNQERTWSSSDKNIATVDNNGLVTAIAEGVVDIVVEAGGLSDTCVVTVEKKVIAVSGITLDRTSVELTEGETTTLVATVAPDDATVKMVAWSTSDEAIATVDNGVVTAVAAGTATITAKAGDKEATCVVTVEKKEEPFPVVADGEYYLYNVEEKQFLSRGEYWGTCATVDRYGIPFAWSAQEGSIKFLDSEAHLFETDDSNIYTDNNSTGFAFEEVEGGYLLKSLKSDRYLTVVDAAFTHQIVNVTDDASAAVVWQLKSKAEHDAIVAAYVEENYTSVIGAAGITATAGAFVDYLATLNAVDMTSAIGTARFEGSVGSWTYNEVRGQENQPAYGTDFCELWQATGNHAQTITGLAEGIYKVTVQGFERSGSWATCNTLAEKGYEITTATLSANGEETNLKSWYSGKSDESNPNNTDEAVAKFADGLYQNEVYTYVGKDGTLTLTLCKPGHVGDNWVLFNNFTLTRYTGSVAVTGITLSQTEATLTEGESLTLTATVSPDDATDKTVTWSSSNGAVATVDNNGVVTAVAEGTATIIAKAGDKEATCVVTVEKKAEEIVYAEIANGDYYLKNVGSGKFLTGANDWGTQASLGEYGLSITLERLPNGKYTLDTHVANNETDHYLGSNGYIDASAAEWIITEPKSGTYALTLDGTSYWGYDGSGTVLANALTDPTQKNAQWQLVTRAKLENALGKATLNNGVDATFYIQGHSFNRNHNENAAWMGEPVLGGPAHDMNAEKFNTTPLDIYQELSGMPNGYYVVEVQGFYRDNVDPNVTAERRAAGTEQLRASLYAGVYSVPLKSILDGATAEQLNAGIQTSYGWVPNSMDETASYFAQGLYINKVDAWVTDGTLRIGIRKETGEEGDWVIFDNFRLTYYGTKAPAGIGQLTIDNGQLTIYDLTGRKVADAENLKGGIYIVNGKKVVIK